MQTFFEKGRVHTSGGDPYDDEDMLEKEELLQYLIQAIEEVNPDARPDAILDAAYHGDVVRLVGIIRGTRV